MNSIVTLSQTGSPVTTSLTIADGVERPHKNILELIRENIRDFEDFGRVAFETRTFETPGGRQQQEVAILNEHHATLLVTFMRNIGVVKEFKKRLVKAFFQMRDEIERRQAPALEGRLNSAAEALKSADAMAAVFGLQGNQRRLSANRLVVNALGVDPMQLLGLDGFETDARPLTPTELGQERGISARKMNAALEHAGLQEAKRDGKGSRYWVPTEAGAEFAVLLDTGKRHGSGAPVTQLKWKPAVLDRLPTPEVAS